MQLYIAHSQHFNFTQELYQPLKNSLFNKDNKLIFPHESGRFINSRETIAASDFLIAEVSYSSLGEGIELGWANSKDIPIICLYKKDQNISHSLTMLSSFFINYKNTDDVLEKLIAFFDNH